MKDLGRDYTKALSALRRDPHKLSQKQAEAIIAVMPPEFSAGTTFHGSWSAGRRCRAFWK